jgi:predicted PurR-regulated permease PerM
MIFVLAEFGAAKAIMIDLPYKSLPVIPPTRSQDIKKQAEYVKKKLQRESKERVRKAIHKTKTYFVKGMVVVLLVALASFFINFSYSKLSSATSSQMQNSESYMIQKQVIMNNIESLNRQIDQKYASIKVLPKDYYKIRKDEEASLKSLEEERRELNKELSDIVSGKKGIEETVSLQIRYAANALGVDVQKYIGRINLGVSIGLVSLYLIFFMLSQSLPSRKKLVTAKKIKRRKR